MAWNINGIHRLLKLEGHEEEGGGVITPPNITADNLSKSVDEGICQLKTFTRPVSPPPSRRTPRSEQALPEVESASVTPPTTISRTTPPAAAHRKETVLRDFLRRKEFPEIVMLQELKMARHDAETIAKLRSGINPLGISADTSSDSEPTYSMFALLPSDPDNGLGPLYGVATAVRDDVLKFLGPPRACTVNWDMEGRLLILLFDRVQLAVANVYALNGSSNVFLGDESEISMLAARRIISTPAGQLGGLIPIPDPPTEKENAPTKPTRTNRIATTRHERKRIFQMRLIHTLEALQHPPTLDPTKRFSVVCAGDLNISRSAIDVWPESSLRDSNKNHVLSRQAFNALLAEGGEEDGVVDVWRRVKGEGARGYTWFARGQQAKARVDLVLVGAEMVNGPETGSSGAGGWVIKNCGIWAGERAGSDHCPIWVDVERRSG